MSKIAPAKTKTVYSFIFTGKKNICIDQKMKARYI